MFHWDTRPANIDGFTPEQRFFLGWAQVWAGKYTPEAERQQVAGKRARPTPLARQRPTLKHARIRLRLWLQTGRQDDPPEGL